jgi:hypothetical protein
LSRVIAKVAPEAVAWKVSADFVAEPIDHVRWSSLPRFAVDDTDKARAIRQRFVDGLPWDQTDLFRRIYAARFAAGEVIRGCASMAALLRQYDERVDGMHADMQANGYRDDADRPIPVYVSHDNAILMGNQGNHRLAMAKLLGVPRVTVAVVAQHPDSRMDLEPAPDQEPDLPHEAHAIPAMTTPAERRCYYRLTRAQAHRGAIVELGAWLGAATAYIAAGIRDAGVAHRAHVYDRFVWKPSSHDKKAGGPIRVTQLEAFRQYLGPLLAYVEPHQTELSALRWRGGDVSLLVCDAPKRITEIATVLATFGKALKPGALMAWQDFAYFPSYDIPAALMRLGGYVEFVEAVYPGTTAVFRVRKAWTPDVVTADALALRRWTPDAVEAAWDEWADRLPAPMRPRFACGAAMFLCDIGQTARAQRRLAAILDAHPLEVLPKWQYLLSERSNLMRRYQPLVEVVSRCAA